MAKLPNIHIGDFASKLLAEGKIGTNTKIPQSPVQSQSLPQAIAPDISKVEVPDAFVDQIAESMKANRKAARKASASGEKFDNPFPTEREYSFGMLDKASQVRKELSSNPARKQAAIDKAKKMIGLSKKKSATHKLPEETLQNIINHFRESKDSKEFIQYAHQDLDSASTERKHAKKFPKGSPQRKSAISRAKGDVEMSKRTSKSAKALGHKLPEETMTKLSDLVEQAKALLKEMTTVGALGTTGGACGSGNGDNTSFKQVKKNRCYKTPGKNKKKRTVEQIVKEVLEFVDEASIKSKVKASRKNYLRKHNLDQSDRPFSQRIGVPSAGEYQGKAVRSLGISAKLRKKGKIDTAKKVIGVSKTASKEAKRKGHKLPEERIHQIVTKFLEGKK